MQEKAEILCIFLKLFKILNLETELNSFFKVKNELIIGFILKLLMLTRIASLSNAALV